MQPRCSFCGRAGGETRDLDELRARLNTALEDDLPEERRRAYLDQLEDIDRNPEKYRGVPVVKLIGKNDDLVPGPSVLICEQCVALCNEILQMGGGLPVG